MQQVKNNRIVNLRAVAIIMVVLGHSIIIYSSSWNLYTTSVMCKPLDGLKKGIDIIQMPIFFSLSGYLYYFSQNKKKFIHFLGDKSRRLMIPFFAFSILWLLPIRLLINYPGFMNKSIIKIIIKDIILGFDNGHLWFLQALFLVFIFMYFISKFLYRINRNQIYIALFIVLFAISYFASVIKNAPIIKNAFQYFVWFYLGYLINRFENILINKKTRVISLVATIILMVLYFAHTSTEVKYLASTSTVIFAYNIISNLYNKALDKIADNSFGIYLFHSPLVYITYSFLSEMNPIVVVSVNFFVFGGLAFYLTSLIKKSPFRIVVGE